MKYCHLISRAFSEAPKRNIIVPEPIAKEVVDNYTHILTDKYSFLLREDLPYNELYSHLYDTPSGVLKYDGIHLFPESIPYRIIQQKYNAYLKRQLMNYRKAFNKCQTPSEIFHLDRRIKSEIKNKSQKIGMLHGRYKHYSVFLSLDQIRQIKTLQEYKKKGVKVKALDYQPIFPSGKVWMPTNQLYLQMFTQYINNLNYSINSVMDIGCGSGVLSFIIGKRFKKAQIVALDKNPSATETCEVNAATLKLNNIKSITVDVLNQRDLQYNLAKEKCPDKYDLIVCNPPWIVAKKLSKQSQLGDGVYDERGQVLKRSLQMAKNYLKNKDSKFLLIYSDLSQILGLQKQSVENICEKYNLLIYKRHEQPLMDKLAANSPLSMFKQKSKIFLYEIGKV